LMLASILSQRSRSKISTNSRSGITTNMRAHALLPLLLCGVPRMLRNALAVRC
jgi:hypothetical protein